MKYITMEEAIRLFHRTKEYINRNCRTGKLECKKVGRDWMIMVDDDVIIPGEQETSIKSHENDNKPDNPYTDRKEKATAEAEAVRAEIELAELQGIRDRPETLKQRENDLSGREQRYHEAMEAFIESQRILDGREVELNELQEVLTAKEQELLDSEKLINEQYVKVDRYSKLKLDSIKKLESDTMEILEYRRQKLEACIDRYTEIIEWLPSYIEYYQSLEQTIHELKRDILFHNSQYFFNRLITGNKVDIAINKYESNIQLAHDNTKQLIENLQYTLNNKGVSDNGKDGL